VNKVAQTIFTRVSEDGKTLDNGNCLQACVATVLNVPLERVPHFGDLDFIDKHDGLFWRGVRKWASSVGLFILEIDKYDQMLLNDCPAYIGIGQSANAVDGHTIRDHAVVLGPNQRLLWDPNPNTGGLKLHYHFMALVVVQPIVFADFVKQPAWSLGMDTRTVFGPPPSVQLDPAVGFPIGERRGPPYFVTGTAIDPVRPGDLVTATGELKGNLVRRAPLSAEHSKAVEEAPRDSMGFRTDMQFADRFSQVRNWDPAEPHDEMRDVENEGQRAMPRKEVP
jgi:hypothetical protein